MKLSRFGFLTALASLVGFAALSFGSSSQAMLSEPGSFVPTECGAQPNITPPISAVVITQNLAAAKVRQICFGEVTGDTNQPSIASIAFRMSDSSQLVLRVAQTSTLLNVLLSGDSKTLFFLVTSDGEPSTMKVLRDHEGRVLNVAGMLGQVPYSISGFEPVVVMQ